MFSHENPKQVHPGVEGFTDENQYLILRFSSKGKPPTEIDVTNRTTAEIGILAEVLGFAHALEEAGLGVFVNVILEKGWLGPELKVDNHDVAELRRLMVALVGGSEVYDGDIFKLQEKWELLKFVAYFLSLPETTQDQEEALLDMGLMASKKELQWNMIERLGKFARTRFT